MSAPNNFGSNLTKARIVMPVNGSGAPVSPTTPQSAVLYYNGQPVSASNPLPVSGSAVPTSQQQRGRVALVAATQSYNIVFSPAFASIPTFFDSNILMVNSSGEVFATAADRSTLTTAGVTVWLAGIPTAASTGSFLNWLAIL